MTLKNYIKYLTKIVKENPSYKDCIVIYAEDDEGNGYQEVHNMPAFLQVHDVNERDLEIVGYLGEENIDKQDINAIIIN